jgi:hypothetical protein
MRHINFMNLRHGLIFGLVAANGFLGQHRASAAATGDDPYATVPTRNIFGLQPLPDATATSAAPLPPAKITPNGIMTLFGKPQVLFKVPAAAVPGQPPPKDHYYILGEGERQDDIEVKKINTQAALITFINHGTFQELSLAAAEATGGAESATPVEALRKRLVSARRPVVDRPQPVSKEEYLKNLGIAANPRHFTGPDGDPMGTDPASETTLAAPTANSAASSIYADQSPPAHLPSANNANDALVPSPLSAQQDATGGDVPDGGDVPPLPREP